MFEKELEQLNNNIDVRATLIALKSELKDREKAASFKEARGYSTELFPVFLSHEDAKVRKNAAILMGYVNEEGYEDSLFEAYQKEDTLFVKSAYLTALASYNYEKYRDLLFNRKKELESGDFEEKDLKHAAEELKALKKLLPANAGHERHRFHNPKTPLRIVLTNRKEMHDELLSETKRVIGDVELKKIFCGVMANTVEITELMKIRIYKDMLFPLNGMKAYEVSKIPAEIINGNLMTLLNSMHDANNNPYFFRISGTDMDVQEIANRIELLSKGKLINSVSDYEIEIRLIRGRDGKAAAFLKLFTVKDRRFLYRKKFVANSISPVNAASIIHLVRRYLRPEAQILDSFCGVGTMLIERNMMVLANPIYGIDIFAEAVAGARENSKTAGLMINYINRNYFDFKHEYLFDEIISNMPVFSSRPDADRFYTDFFEKSKELLKEDGIIIIYSDEKNIIKKNIRLSEEYKLIREYVFNEREGYSVFVIGRQDF